MKRARQSPGSRWFWLAVAALAIVLEGCGELLAQEPGTVVAADKRVQGRDYVFPETGERLPYALFVPSNYDAAKKWPLIVGLHGGGRPYDWLMGYEGIIDFAQRDGYIMVTPLGYHPDDTVPVADTRQWVAKMKELHMEVLYVEISGGEHTPFISKNQDTLSKVFSFFNIVRKDQRPATK